MKQVHPEQRAQQARGYTLIELAICIGVLGLVMVLIWRYGFVASQRIAEVEAPPVMTIAEQALMGFVAAQNRLPCPDSNADGIEDCGGSNAAPIVGRLPLVTLGIARTDLRHVRYGVYRAHSDTAMLDADLAVARDRFRPLMTIGSPPTAVRAPLGTIGGIDFCTALANAGSLNLDDARLHIRDGAGVAMRNVAYALALPGSLDADGDGDPFDGANSVAVSFAASPQAVSTGYDDTVRVADFSQIFERMACGGMLAAAGHAHPNVASGAAILTVAMTDYQVQLELAAETAGVKVAGATAGVASAAAGVSTAAATMLIAVSQTLVSQGALAGIIAAGAAAVAANSVATVVSAATLALAIAGKVEADGKVAAFQPIRAEAATLAAETRVNAISADGADMFR